MFYIAQKKKPKIKQSKFVEAIDLSYCSTVEFKCDF